MTNEFKKISKGKETRYVLESGTTGGTTTGGLGGSIAKPMGGIQRRQGDNLLTPESDQEKVKQKPRQGPLRTQTGGGAHKDKTKTIPRKEKYKQAIAELAQEPKNEKATKSLHNLMQRYPGLSREDALLAAIGDMSQEITVQRNINQRQQDQLGKQENELEDLTGQFREKEDRFRDLNAKLKSGQITKAQADAERKEIEREYPGVPSRSDSEPERRSDTTPVKTDKEKKDPDTARTDNKQINIVNQPRTGDTTSGNMQYDEPYGSAPEPVATQSTRPQPAKTPGARAFDMIAQQTASNSGQGINPADDTTAQRTTVKAPDQEVEKSMKLAKNWQKENLIDLSESTPKLDSAAEIDDTINRFLNDVNGPNYLKINYGPGVSKNLSRATVNKIVSILNKHPTFKNHFINYIITDKRQMDAFVDNLESSRDTAPTNRPLAPTNRPGAPIPPSQPTQDHNAGNYSTRYNASYNMREDAYLDQLFDTLSESLAAHESYQKKTAGEKLAKRLDKHRDQAGRELEYQKTQQALKALGDRMKPKDKTQEAANAAQQAAIAINMKKHHKKPKNEDVAEGGGMPSTVVKMKQKLAMMTPEELLARFEEVAQRTGKSVEQLARSMAWRHGYGKNSDYYWNKIQKAKADKITLNPIMGGVEHSTDDINQQGVAEEWSQKYKKSINCSHPKGFSQKAHCAGKKKHNEDVSMEMTCPDCGMCKTHGDNMMEVKQRLDAHCWHNKKIGKPATKIKGGVRVNNCVPKEGVAEGDDLTHAGQDVMIWLGPPTNNPPRDDKKYWIRGKLVSTEMHGGSMRANVMTAKGMYNPELSRVFNVEQVVAEGDDLTHAGQDVMIWLGPPTNNPPRDDKKYWIRGKLDSTEKHGGAMRANVMTAKGMYNPELSRVFNVEQGVAEGDEYNEYSDEVDMVENNLLTIIRACKELAHTLKSGENLPEWVEEKISMSKQNMVTVSEYLQSQHAQGHIYDEDHSTATGGWGQAARGAIYKSGALVGAGHDDRTMEAMLPASVFAGSKKNKLGPAGQWRNKGPKKNSPARAGDLVGGAAESIQREATGPQVGMAWQNAKAGPTSPEEKWKRQVRTLATQYQKNPSMLANLAKETGQDSIEQVAWEYLKSPSKGIRVPGTQDDANNPNSSTFWSKVAQGLPVQPTLQGQDLLNAAVAELKKLGYGHDRELLANVMNGNALIHKNIQSAYDRKVQRASQVGESNDYLSSLQERLDQEMAERSKSQAQAQMMAAAAHNPAFAKKVGIKTNVAKEFNRADTGKDISKLPRRVIPKKRKK